MPEGARDGFAPFLFVGAEESFEGSRRRLLG